MSMWSAIACISLCLLACGASLFIGFILGLRFSDDDVSERIQGNNQFWKAELADRDDYWMQRLESVTGIVPIGRGRMRR